jgi:DNA helicase II / ATP-dependent DNA helicase PcrA
VTDPQATSAAPFVQGLNPQQQAAVTAGPGPVLVLAGPGSGKTRVLTHRVGYLMSALHVQRWHIMAVTFTNKAAREMAARVEALMGEERLRGLSVGTFHAICARILRRESDNLDYYARDFVIFDRDDQLQVVKQSLADLNLDEKRFQPAKMLNYISAAKNELVTAELYAASNYIAEITRRVYSHYQELLRANNAMDFDDLLMNTVLLFDARPDVLQKYQQQYEHILVDEFQDTNTTQYALLTRLAAPQNNLFAVGDSDQSIYRWRGADFRNINRFREHYPGAELILLEQNYRSTQIILDAAKAVIRRNTDRVDKELFTQREGGVPIVVREVYTEREEADMVVDTIRDLQLEGYSPSACAIMYRTNAQSRALEEAFLQRGMPYKLVGATRFYSRREIKDIVAYLRVVHNLADAVSFNRIVNTPTRGIGRKTQDDLQRWAARQGLQPAEALLLLATDPDIQHPFSGRAYNVLHDFGQLLTAWTIIRDKFTVGDLMDHILDDVNYKQYIDDGTDESQDRWGNVMELRAVAGMAEDAELSEFLEQISLVSEVDDLEEEQHAPTLLTLHAAKGLEFPIVFITGLEEGILPHSRSLEEPEELEEERRLFYVGLTRAEDRVYLLYSFRRTTYGQSDVAVPSRFLGDIPDTLTDGQTIGIQRERTVNQASSWSWDQGANRQRDRQARRERRSWYDNDNDDGWYRDPDETRGRRIGGRRGDDSYGPPAPPPSGPGFVSTRRRSASSEPERPAAPNLTPDSPSFRSGQKVRHARFGDGIVVESRVTGNDEEVTVAFKSEGIKKLAASFANLERLD